MRWAGALFCLFLFSRALAGAQDFQSWNEVDLSASWGTTDFLVPLVARVDARLPNLQLAATGLLGDERLPWHVTVIGGYLFAELPQRSPSVVHIPLVAVLKAFHAGRLTLADRNRFEKLIGFGTSPVRYRNQFLVDLPLGSQRKWHVFSSDEVFFDFSASRWNQNRFQAGGGRRLSSRFLLDVYYLQKYLSGGAAETRVVGTDLTIVLKPR